MDGPLSAAKEKLSDCYRLCIPSAIRSRGAGPISHFRGGWSVKGRECCGLQTSTIEQMACQTTDDYLHRRRLDEDEFHGSDRVGLCHRCSCALPNCHCACTWASATSRPRREPQVHPFTIFTQGKWRSALTAKDASRTAQPHRRPANRGEEEIPRLHLYIPKPAKLIASFHGSLLH
jgi:hypothetical protein